MVYMDNKNSYTEAQKKATKKYRENNKDKVKAQRKTYYENRKAKDPNFLEYKRNKAKEYYVNKKNRSLKLQKVEAEEKVEQNVQSDSDSSSLSDISKTTSEWEPETDSSLSDSTLTSSESEPESIEEKVKEPETLIVVEPEIEPVCKKRKRVYNKKKK